LKIKLGVINDLIEKSKENENGTGKGAGVGIDRKLLAEIRLGIEQEFNEADRLPSNYYSPSGMNCSRAMFYKSSGVSAEQEKKNMSTIGILESGTDRHLRIQQYFIKSKTFKYLDVSSYIESQGDALKHLKVVRKSENGVETMVLDTRYGIQFLADGLIEYDGKIYVLEIKTETSYKYQSRKGIAPEHLTQGITYSICFGLDDILFLYECRDNCDKKIYHFKPTEQMKKDYVLDKIALCDEAKKTGIPPVVDRELMNCRYCKYKKRCQQD
jgi:CRISPR/Cas system-associated exonuclease Cas4 (RecB family)